MASDPLPVLPQVPVPRKGNVWATLSNDRGDTLTVKLPDDVLWPPFYLLVGQRRYTFTNWEVPADVNARIDVTYTPTDAAKVVDVTGLVAEARKGRAA